MKSEKHNGKNSYAGAQHTKYLTGGYLCTYIALLMRTADYLCLYIRVTLHLLNGLANSLLNKKLRITTNDNDFSLKFTSPFIDWQASRTKSKKMHAQNHC